MVFVLLRKRGTMKKLVFQTKRRIKKLVFLIKRRMKKTRVPNKTSNPRMI